jgi:hypothetical protein
LGVHDEGQADARALRPAADEVMECSGPREILCRAYAFLRMTACILQMVFFAGLFGKRNGQ